MIASGERSGYAAAVLVAAGRGERFGHAGKVLAESCGRPLVAWSLDAMEAAASVRDVVIVFGAHTEIELHALVANGPWTKVTALVEGGSNRQESVSRGVSVAADDLEVVLIHDAARPMVEAAQFDACAQQARTMGAAILAIPVADTLKRVANGLITETVPRAGMWAAQTPQAFRLAAYRDAVAVIHGREHEFTDDASIFEASGQPVAIVPGSLTNIKVTQLEDLALVELLLRARSARLDAEMGAKRG